MSSCFLALFAKLFQCLVNEGIIDVLGEWRDFLALIKTFLGAKFHGLVIGDLADQPVLRKGLEILHEVLVIILSAFAR